MTGNPATRLLVVAGGALLLGVGVYALTRPIGSAYLLPAILEFDSSSLSLPAILGGSLPAFLHVYTFALLTIVVLGVTPKRAAWAAAAWCALDLLFEFGQWPPLAERLAAGLPGWFGQVPVLDHVGAYFVQGSFDPVDLLATLLGAVMAYVTALLILHGRCNHGHEEEKCRAD